MNNYVKINADAINKQIARRGMTKTELSRRMGRSDTYITNCIYNGKMLKKALELLASILDADYYDLVLRENVPLEGNKERDGWSVDLDIRSVTKLRIVYRFNGEQVAQAWATIKGHSQADLFEAIARASAYISETENQKRMEEKSC